MCRLAFFPHRYHLFWKKKYSSALYSSISSHLKKHSDPFEILLLILFLVFDAVILPFICVLACVPNCPFRSGIIHFICPYFYSRPIDLLYAFCCLVLVLRNQFVILLFTAMQSTYKHNAAAVIVLVVFVYWSIQCHSVATVICVLIINLPWSFAPHWTRIV